MGNPPGTPRRCFGPSSGRESRCPRTWQQQQRCSPGGGSNTNPGCKNHGKDFSFPNQPHFAGDKGGGNPQLCVPPPPQPLTLWVPPLRSDGCGSEARRWANPPVMEHVPAPAGPRGRSSAGLFMAFRGGERNRSRCRRALTQQKQPETGLHGPQHPPPWPSIPLPGPWEKQEWEEEERGGRLGQSRSTSQRNVKSRSTSSSSSSSSRVTGRAGEKQRGKTDTAV